MNNSPVSIFFKESHLKLFIWVVLLSAFIFDATHIFVDYYLPDSLYIFSPVASFSAIPRFVAWLIALIDFLLGFYAVSSNKGKVTLGFVIFFLIVNLILQTTFVGALGYLTYIVKLTLPLLMFRLLSRLSDIMPFAKISLLYFFINSLVTLLAVVFELDVFRVYGGSRFGYYGLMIAANQLSFVFITLLTMLVLMKKFINDVFFYILFVFFFGAAISLGTKALWGSLMVFYVIAYFDGRISRFFIFSTLFIGLSYLLFFVSRQSGFQYFESLIESHGWVFTITSKRNELILSVFWQYLLDFDLWNYLFGGVNLKNGFVEMDLLDIFLSIGIVGLYLFVFVVFKTLFSFSKKSILAVGFVLLYFTIGIFAGHALTNALNFVFLPIVCVLFYNDIEKK